MERHRSFKHINVNHIEKKYKVHFLKHNMLKYYRPRSYRTSFQLADIRLNSDSASNDLPHTSHSGKCGVAGDFITLPVEFVMDSEETVEGIATAA